VIPEQFKGLNVIKFGRTSNCRIRFRDYGDLEIIKIAEDKDLVKVERELHERAKIYFGKAVFHKEYYLCDDISIAVEIFNEIVEKYI
jgi:hypothetical protein